MPTLRATAGGTATSGTLAVTVPAGTAAGDVLLIDVTVSATGAVPATPSGLTLLDSGSSGPSFATYYRVCDGTEPASYSFTISATASGTSRSYTGVDNVSPINAHGAPNRLATTGNATANSITTTVNGCMLVFCAGNSANSASFTNPTGFGNQAYRHTSGQSNATASCDETQATAGATGSVTGTFSVASANTYASLIALAPAGGGAPVSHFRGILAFG